ncbi:MAG: START domain-containing protein [Candidatus Omnitrophica bacterium]|nr:START domain-containing protein [Candidatus Omnitrophota bacterium]
MPKFGLLGFIAAFFLLSATALANDTGGWHLKKDEDGIKIFSRKVEGSPVSEFQGVVSVKAPLDRVIELYEDAARVHEWMYHCKEFREIQKEGSSEKFFYFHQKLQWPVSDRDVVTSRVRDSDPKTGAISYRITVSPGIYPIQENIVRIALFKSFWQFTPQEGGAIEVRYQILLDPAGSVPKWLVNQNGIDFPFYSLKRFKELLE